MKGLRPFAPLPLKLSFKMARVIIIAPREQEAHFGLYRTSAGGDEGIFVRRKVGEPTDYIHGYSRKLKRQREMLAVASRHWSHLTPGQKADWRQQIRWVSRIPPGSKSEEVILKGRQLFISEEIHSLATTQKQLLVPYEFCIMLVDEDYNALDGDLKLSYKEAEEWLLCKKEQIDPGSWLFSKVPAEKEAYRPYGEAEGYIDPELEELQFMSAKEVRAHHYHILTIPGVRCCYAEPRGYLGHWRTSGTRRSQLFKPVANFTLTTFIVYLLAYPYPFEPPPSSGFIAIHGLTGDTTPSEPPLAEAHFNISLPEWPNVMACPCSIPPLELQIGKYYNWVIGFPPPLKPQSYIAVVRDKTGVCNAGIEYGNALSYWKDDHWTNWQRQDIPFCAYEARGY